MRIPLALLAGLALAALVLVSWFLTAGPTPSPESPTVGTPAPADPDPALGSSPAAQTARARAADEAKVPPSALAPAVLLAHVVDGSGAPLAGRTVVLGLEQQGRRRSIEETSDPAGQARFELEGGTVVVDVQVPVGPRSLPAHGLLRRYLGPGERLEHTLVVEGGHTLRGRVLDADDRPVADAEVLAWCNRDRTGEPDRRVRSAADGSFALPHLGDPFVALARKEDLTTLEGLRGRLHADAGGADLVLRLGPGGSLRGRVLGPDRLPRPGARVWVEGGLRTTSNRDGTSVPGITRFGADSAETVTDEDGTFELRGLARGEAFVQASSPPLLVHREHHRVGSRAVEIVLEAGLSLTGRVFDAGGDPAQGVRVAWGPYRGNVNSGPSEVTSDADGRFRIVGMDEDGGSHWLRFLHAGHAVHFEQPVEPGEDGGRPVSVHLELEQPLAGRVVDREGRPVAGAPVAITGDREYETPNDYGRPPTWEWRAGLDATRADADGRFRFSHLYAGSFRIQAFDPARPELFVETTVRSGRSDLELVLDRSTMRLVTLTGRVVDAATGGPLGEYTLIPMRDGRGSHHEVRDPQGRFELTGLEPGPVQLLVQAPGYATLRLPERDHPAGEHTLELSLEPAASLHLLVVDEAGEPHTGGVVRALDLDGEPIWFQTSGFSTGTVAQLRDGEVHLHGLPRAPLEVHVDLGFSGGSFEFDPALTGDDVQRLVLPRIERMEFGALVLLLPDETRRAEALDLLARVRSGRDLDLLQRAVDEGLLARPSRTLELTFLHEGHEVAWTRIEPLVAGRYLVVDRMPSSWHEGVESEREVPEPAIRLGLPRGRVELEARSSELAGSRTELVLDTDGADPEMEFLLLQRR